MFRILYHRPLVFLFYLALCLPLGCLSHAQDNPPDVTYRVALKESRPFSFKDAEGEWTGISVELWQELADNIAIKYSFEEASLQAMLNGVEDGSYDFAIGALTITPEREARLDFSHSFYNTGLGIATAKQGHPVVATIRRFLTLEFLLSILGLCAVIFIGGFFVWLFERKRNPQFAGKRGIGSGFWWSAVTMTTVGYGDKAPVTFGGRIVGLIWMFLSLVIVSSLVAAISSSLTIETLSSGIQSVADLTNARVATVAGSSSQEYLQARRINSFAYNDLNHALQAIVSGSADAVVYDKPLLQYLVNNDPTLAQAATVLDITFERQDYGFAMQSNSPLREALNQELLRITTSDNWENIVESYLGID